MRHDPDGRRAAVAARHPRNRSARLGARTLGRRRHQRCAHHGERGAAPGGGRSSGTVPVPRCARSRSSRPFPEGAWGLAKHGRGSGDPQPDRAPLHRADDRRLAQSRRARGDRRLRVRAPRRQGLEPLLPGADRSRAVRVGHHPRTVRRGSCLALPDPEEVRPPDAREREVRAALHQDHSGERRRAARSDPDGRRIGGSALVNPGFVARPVLYQDLLRRGRRMPGGHALYGDTAQRRCHALPLSPGLRGEPSSLRVSRTSGLPRSCSPTFAAAPRSAEDAASAR